MCGKDLKGLLSPKASFSGGVGSLLGFSVGDPLLGGALGTLYGTGNLDSLQLSAHARDDLEQTYESLHFIGGKAMAKNSWTGRNDRIAADQAREEAKLTPNPAPLPPNATAMIVNPAAELRDRRRRAIMEQRRTFGFPGPGANIPLG